jgi:hypothetical protein
MGIRTAWGRRTEWENWIFIIGTLARDVAEKIIPVPSKHRRDADKALPFLEAAP